MQFNLDTLVSDFAYGMMFVDQRRPQKKPYQPGIGPHTESETVELVVEEIANLYPERYRKHAFQVPYLGTRQKCDVCFGEGPLWEWAIEVKMVRFFGDNGKPADTIITHLLSPYSSDHSAVSDAEKLAQSNLNGRKAILIYGFDYSNRPLEPAIEAFETLAQLKVRLGVRVSCAFQELIHPILTRGKVFAWEIFQL